MDTFTRDLVNKKEILNYIILYLFESHSYWPNKGVSGLQFLYLHDFSQFYVRQLVALMFSKINKKRNGRIESSYLNLDK